MNLKNYPFYIQATVVLFGLILLVYALSILTDILIPLAFAAFISILLNPLSQRFERLKIPRPLAILLSMLIAALVLAGLFYFLSSQLSQFGDALPMLKQKLMVLYGDTKHWVTAKFGVAESKQDQVVKNAIDKSASMVGQTINGVLGILAVVLLLPVYVFFMLLYKSLLLNFLYEAFAEENSKKVSEVLAETKTAVQSYIVGLLIETLIVATLNSLALILLGVKYGILIGTIGAILNLIPYLGGIVAIALPLLIATMTKDGYSTQIGVVVSYLVIQFIDNNILVPRIVSSKVQINALVSIIVVLLGNQLWGISGMFLSIPFTAIIKIIFDRIDNLKPWGKLLGDNIPSRHKGELWHSRFRRKAVSAK